MNHPAETPEETYAVAAEGMVDAALWSAVPEQIDTKRRGDLGAVIAAAKFIQSGKCAAVAQTVHKG
jgi:hypothetical protein